MKNNMLETNLTTSMDTPTWPELAAMEPALDALMSAVRLERQNEHPPECMSQRWYHQIKPRLTKLVGWGRKPEHRLLSSDEAYDVAYRTLYDALPSCVNCRWCTPEAEWEPET